MKKILVAINFSEQSSIVLKYALKLAQYLSAEIGVIYVLPQDKINRIKGKFTSDLKEANLKLALEKLDSFIASQYGKQYHAIPIDSYTRIGKASEEISEIAFSIKADLIIVGKHYQSSSSFFDDTADSLISNSPCPVMTVPDNEEFHPFKRIIYASDFLLEDCAAIIELQEWATIFKGEIICIHVSDNKEKLIKSKRKMTILRKLFPQENIKFRCFRANINKAIERYATITNADIQSTMHKDRNMFKLLFQTSVSKELSDHSSRPMIVFHQSMMSINK